MRKRLLTGGCILVIGLIMIASSIIASISHLALPLANALVGGIGVVFLIVGFLVFIAETLESFLSRGQVALVDGLQAG